MDKKYISLDIGGTKIAAALVGIDGSIQHVVQEPTSQDGAQTGFEQIREIVQKCLDREQNPVAGIGIGIPAALETDTDKIIWAPNIHGWRNVDLRAYLEECFGIPVCIEYDGHTAVLGEYWQGAGKGFNSVLDVIIGTGIGAGAIINGNLIRGANRLAGALGWQVLSTEPAKADPNSSHIGFWENLAAGPGIAKYANTHLSEDEKKSITGSVTDLTAKDLFDAAKNGNTVAIQMCDGVAEWIGLGIANAVSILNPEIVILGGSVGHACGFIEEKILQTVKAWAQPNSAGNVKIAISNLGTDAGILGAAYAVLLRSSNKEDRRD